MNGKSTTARFLILLMGTSLAGLAPVQADEFEREPINYSKRTGDNRVTRLIANLQTGKEDLKHEPGLGYLRSILAQLEVPESSQTLVFSKTSLQRQRIAPETPRALYFSDDVYIGYCREGDVLEVSAVDKELGAVFYTLDQKEMKSARITRQTDNCLICHASSSTKNVPGFVVRSVYSDAAGFPILASGTYRTNHASPFSQRWGGWYVTGTHGEQKHLGNLVVRDQREPEQVDNSAGQNVTELSGRFDPAHYLTPHSDLVALMVLEHQVDAHNLITGANFATLQALHYEQSLNRELGKPADEHWDSTKSRIKSACEPLVEYLLFCEETPLTHKITGTSSFAREFAQRGPCDSRGRSLRQFDLERRMFKYPCSYLVYSESFGALPKDAKGYVFRRFGEILSGQEKSDKFNHLSAEDRLAIREILAETLPGFAPFKTP